MFISSLKNGFISGVKSCWFLIKIIIPVYLAITILKNSPAMGWLASVCAPLMGAFHLPGKAAVPFIAGAVLDEYGVIAAIKAVNLTGFAVTVVAVMAMISHSLFVEAAILRKLGMSITFFTVYRITESVIIGLALRFIGEALNLW